MLWRHQSNDRSIAHCNGLVCFCTERIELMRWRRAGGIPPQLEEMLE
jgi:hypothetical protein